MTAHTTKGDVNKATNHVDVESAYYLFKEVSQKLDCYTKAQRRHSLTGCLLKLKNHIAEVQV